MIGRRRVVQCWVLQPLITCFAYCVLSFPIRKPSSQQKAIFLRSSLWVVSVSSSFTDSFKSSFSWLVFQLFFFEFLSI